VEDLAFGLGIGIITAIDLSITGKSRFGNLSQDRVVLTRNTGNVSREGLKLKITGA
jgi:hypothetical protein